MMNQVYLPAVRAECTKLVGGKSGLRIAANICVAAKATPSRKQPVGVLKLRVQLSGTSQPDFR